MSDEFDVIVVGAGLAGLCCAGELVLRGHRPLLICETSEVASLYRTTPIGKSRAMMQHPTRQVSWGGGWWYGLVRDLNIPVRMQRSYPGFRAMIRGTGVVNDLSISPSAASLAATIGRLSPVPLGDSLADIERVLGLALAIPYQELCGMQEVPLATWLAEQNAEAITTLLLLMLGGNLFELSVQDAAQHLSVFGTIGALRSYVCAEADIWAIEPDARQGLCIPIANEVERRGGAVWKGRRVSRILIDDGRARGVQLADGTEVHGPLVAYAGGNGRLAALFDNVPPEVQPCLDYEAQMPDLQHFSLVSLLDRPVDQDPRKLLLLINPDGSAEQAFWSLQEVAPWTTEPGKYLLASERFMTQKEVADAGGPEAVFEEMRSVSEEAFPGYNAAICEVIQQHYTPWIGPFTVGPKLPRTISSVRDLWFVGEGSAPVGGVYMETSASAGILGARAIAELLASKKKK